MNDNARKIFSMLGVEPNEEFNIKDMNGPWKIDETLNIYYRQGRNNNGDYVYNYFDNSLIIDLINGSERIIKLPKKKKLKYWTEEDWNKWKEKNCYYNGYYNCDKCSFCHVNCSSSEKENSWIHHKDLYSDKFLNQEVEVEE